MRNNKFPLYDISAPSLSALAHCCGKMCDTGTNMPSYRFFSKRFSPRHSKQGRNIFGCTA